MRGFHKCRTRHLEADFVQTAFAEGVMRTMVRLAEKGLLEVKE